MRIDACAFLGDFGALRYTPRGLVRHIESCELDLALVAPISAAGDSIGGENADEPAANCGALDLSRVEPRCRALYWVRAGQQDSNALAIAGALSSEPFVGVVLAPGLNDFELTDPEVEPLMIVCARLSVPAIVILGESEAAGPFAAGQFAKAYSRVPVILMGGARPEMVKETVEVIRRSASREDSRVFVATEGADFSGVQSLVNKIGAKRVIFASGAGVEENDVQARTSELVRAIGRGYSPAVSDAIFWRNAFSIFPAVAAHSQAAAATAPAK